MSTDCKEVVRRFNIDVIQNGNEAEFRALMASNFVNHAAPKGMPNGPDGMWHTFENVLRPALSDLTVTIHDQIAEGDKVTTRKTISGTHTGTLLGVPATGKKIAIDVIDIVRVEDGKYAEHWGLNTLSTVLAELAKA
ncbi:ester cyclase [Oryzifoliimicrobium ureilyticus]|uniref:ester cyclase n=1 Tax=Oryzifoliimicrobium ureilyticus TaxID=3113724 RepID=UPI0030762D25